MRQSSLVALAIVFVILSFAFTRQLISTNVSFTTVDVPTGTDPEATVGDTL